MVAGEHTVAEIQPTAVRMQTASGMCWLGMFNERSREKIASATLSKKKEFSVLWAVIGFLICLFPLLIYIIWYAVQTDKVVEIIVQP